MRENLDGLQGELQYEERMIMNLHYSDDIILLATSRAELQESPRQSQPQIQPTHQRRQHQSNGNRRHSVLHTHSR